MKNLFKKPVLNLKSIKTSILILPIILFTIGILVVSSITSVMTNKILIKEFEEKG